VSIVGILITVVIAAVAYLILVALGLPSIVGIIAAVLILIAGITSGGFGLGARFGGGAAGGRGPAR
jgi:hypothetical protein